PLVSTVAQRVSYRPEPDDYWSAPDDVWASRSGDCEDHAMVVSAYLSRQNVDHTLLGLSLKSGLEGHVVVVVTGQDRPILLDPTGATAQSGIERFPPGTALREVAAKYATLPAQRYGPNVSPGDPEPVGTVE
ncbi:MAG TPA: transglutaminase-like domain-containing protein, partial [Alkalispirochaeta sp.]|nr:transglutaminase-like domain-containing protein [Alkalispirochaeta sp.]